MNSPVLSARELEDFLDGQGVAPLTGVLVADAAYALPAEDWVTWEFAATLGQWLTRLHIAGWVAESWDCDDFAAFARLLASLMHNRTRPGASGLALGEFWYFRADGGGHAINLFVTRQRGELALRFLEPQTGRLVALTRKEIESCTAYRF